MALALRGGNVGVAGSDAERPVQLAHGNAAIAHNIVCKEDARIALQLGLGVRRRVSVVARSSVCLERGGCIAPGVYGSVARGSSALRVLTGGTHRCVQRSGRGWPWRKGRR